MNDLITLIGAIGGIGTSIFTGIILCKWLIQLIKPSNKKITSPNNGKSRSES